MFWRASPTYAPIELPKYNSSVIATNVIQCSAIDTQP